MYSKRMIVCILFVLALALSVVCAAPAPQLQSTGLGLAETRAVAPDTGTQRGPSGRVVLATVTLRALAPGRGRLSLDVVQVANTLGQAPGPWATGSGTVTVAGIPGTSRSHGDVVYLPFIVRSRT